MSGTSEFNEVFLTDARTPDWPRVEVGDGWRVANATLMNERVSVGGGIRPRGSGPIATALGAWAKRSEKDPVRRDELAKLWIEAEVLRLGNIRTQVKRDAGVPSPEGSVLKLGSALLQQRIASLVGARAAPVKGVDRPASGSGRGQVSVEFDHLCCEAGSSTIGPSRWRHNPPGASKRGA
jgi:alkylation response protein AidB-like acyl-CoA dehydrogenase